MNDSAFWSVDPYSITSAVFYIKEATGSAGVTVNLHAMTSSWTETGITWNSHDSSYSSFAEASASLSYENYAAYDITTLV